ncbi:MAG: hypothetical protein ACE14P_03050 [Methanotrichaceae archaeon]
MKYYRILLAGALLIFLVSQVHSQEDSMDPVARQLMESMDTPIQSAEAGSNSAMANNDLFFGNKASRSITGDWNLELENGAKINLALSQSGSLVFGSGNITSAASAQLATASGSLSGDILKLNIVPADGTKLYALYLDLSGQTPSKTYNIFSADTGVSSGTVRKVSYSTLE